MEDVKQVTAKEVAGELYDPCKVGQTEVANRPDSLRSREDEGVVRENLAGSGQQSISKAMSK